MSEIEYFEIVALPDAGFVGVVTVLGPMVSAALPEYAHELQPELKTFTHTSYPAVTVCENAKV